MEYSKGIRLHPYIRVLFLTSMSVSIIITNNLTIFGVVYLFFLIPLFVCSQDLKKHIRLFVLGMLPILFSYILLYKIIPAGSEYSYISIFNSFSKIVLFTSLLQLFLSIPADDLISTFKKYRIDGDYLIFIIGSFTVWADVFNKANKIISARLSRGFVAKRSIINYLKQIPSILIPLIISIIRTSIERVRSWEQRNTLLIFKEYKAKTIYYPLTINLFVAFTSLLFLVLCILISNNIMFYDYF